MSKETETIHSKLDRLIVYSVKHEEHLRQINGTLERHEKEIKFNSSKVNMGMGGLGLLALLLTMKAVGLW